MDTLKIAEVFQTKNYDLFTNIEGNRNLNMIHLNRLKKSIQDNYLFTCLIVNENYEIIDGQHRFEALKELELPINYVMIRGYNLKHVQILNQNSRSWQMDDFIDAYVKLGYKDYLIYQQFQQKYGLSHTVTYALLLNTTTSLKSETKKHFGRGLFKVKNYNKAVLYAERIMMLKDYFVNYKDRNYIFAMIKLFDSDVFDFNEYMQKLKLQPKGIQPCKTIRQYIENAEDIYNYKRRDKISFKYLK